MLITAFPSIGFVYLTCIQQINSAQSKQGETLGRKAAELKKREEFGPHITMSAEPPEEQILGFLNWQFKKTEGGS
jgi:hypothetical protein